MVVKVLIRLACIRECINPTTAMRLINSMITNTPLQEELITFKVSMGKVGTREQHVTVSTGYWRGFKKRNKDKIMSKKGQTYEPDISSWITYSNFNHIRILTL